MAHFQTTDSSTVLVSPAQPSRKSDIDAARLALKQVWEQLAPIVDEVRELEERTSQDPRLLSQPLVAADTRWLQLFGREITAVQTIYAATQAGARLTTDEIRKARDTAQKLLGLIEDGRHIVGSRHHAAPKHASLDDKQRPG